MTTVAASAQADQLAAELRDRTAVDGHAARCDAFALCPDCAEDARLVQVTRAAARVPSQRVGR